MREDNRENRRSELHQLLLIEWRVYLRAHNELLNKCQLAACHFLFPPLNLTKDSLVFRFNLKEIIAKTVSHIKQSMFPGIVLQDLLIRVADRRGDLLASVRVVLIRMQQGFVHFLPKRESNCKNIC